MPLGWCGECWEPVYRVSVHRPVCWFGPCGHVNAGLLQEEPIRWRA